MGEVAERACQPTCRDLRSAGRRREPEGPSTSPCLIRWSGRPPVPGDHGTGLRLARGTSDDGPRRNASSSPLPMGEAGPKTGRNLWWPVSDDPRSKKRSSRCSSSGVTMDDARLPPPARVRRPRRAPPPQVDASASASHVAENRQLVEHRIQSLTVSHRARARRSRTRSARATNEKIRLMKESELARPDADFDRRMAELRQAAEGGHPSDPDRVRHDHRHEGEAST